jgi:hypothetical protein
MLMLLQDPGEGTEEPGKFVLLYGSSAGPGCSTLAHHILAIKPKLECDRMGNQICVAC